MECEVKVKDNNSSGAALCRVLEEQVKAATDKLLLTDFPACVSLCRHIVSAAKSHEDCDSDSYKESLSHVKEAATVLAIQALAEQGLWRDVIPFVEQAYGHVRECPAKVIQMCILLHAHVREYLVCHSLVNNWLDNEKNQSHPESANIVKIYVTNVLVPLGAFNLIPQVVESCVALSPEDKQMLLSPSPPPSESKHLDVDRLPAECRSNSSDTPTEVSPSHEVKKDRAKEIIPMYVNLVRRLWRSLSKKGWCRKVCRASKVLLLFSFAVLALVHLQTDVVSHFSRAMEVWRTALRVWSAMLKTGR
ncbi:hypothetical protein BaRGS_00005344 [Batillaria attramentaria]|uniref:Peroxisome assembly protein 26 n=1 Tax=Batillaria attramentaria TaxID=370345 RepID=A0ABD0LVJ3_9CAEN